MHGYSNLYGLTQPSLGGWAESSPICDDLSFIGLRPAQYVMVWIFMGQTRHTLAH